MGIKNNIILFITFQLLLFSCIIICDVKITLVHDIHWKDATFDCYKEHLSLRPIIAETLHRKEYIEFQCNSSIIHGDNCKCEVTWGDDNRYFYAYLKERDEKLCGNECRWFMEYDGQRLANSSIPIDDEDEEQEFIASYPWLNEH